MNTVLHLLSVGSGWSGCQAYKAHKCYSTDASLTPESFVWFDLGNKSTLVRVSERLWFCLKVNEHVDCIVNLSLLSQTQSFPKHHQVMGVSKCNYKKV